MKPNIDHLVYTSPTLNEGMDRIEQLLGVRPVIGGRHLKWGTHNALLSLGDSTYLEVVAPDPELHRPERGRWLEGLFQRGPRLATWVLRSENIDALHAKALESGVPLGQIEAGRREKPDGSVLSWRLTDPYAMPFDGAVPFLISWGDTPHPAGSLPGAGSLRNLSIAHPDPMSVRSQLEPLGVDIEVKKSSQFEIVAEIESVEGRIITLQ